MPVLSSLVITVYNRERYLGAAIESVLAQTRGDFELLVWDDGSTDRSVQIAQNYARQDARVRVVAAQHQGRGRALKDAIAQTNGSYIGLVDSDDILAPTALEETAAVLDAHPATGLVYTDYLVMNESGEVTGYGSRCRFPYSPSGLLRKFMTFHFRVIRRTVFEQVGGINQSFYVSEDYELCLRLSEITQVERVSKPLYYYRVHRESITQQQKAEQNRLCLKAVKQALNRRQLAGYFPVTLLSCAEFSTEPSQNLPIAPLFKAELIHPLQTPQGINPLAHSESRFQLTSSITRVNPLGIQIPGSQLKSSLDDWVRVLVHFNGLDLLARSLNSGRFFGLTENGASSKVAQDCVSSIAKRFTQSLAKNLSPFLAALPLLGAISVTPALAQIVPAADGTNTLVNTTGNQLDITGGQTSSNGANLFHSFSQFDLNAGQTANFQSNTTIQNILGRVVSGNASNINGLIQVSGSQANLYLMNPAGIIFGSNASLNVPADFVATTATSIGIGNNWFNAAGTNDYAQLNGTPNAFAFTTPQPGSIVNSGNLAVGEGKNLAIVGGTVVSTGELNAPAGKIIVAAVPGESLVRLSQPGMVLSLEVLPPASSNNSPTQWTLPVLSLPQLLTGGGGNNATGISVNANGQVALTGSGVQVPTEPGTSIVSGTLNASGTAPNQMGGEVNILGDKVGLVSANIDVSGTNGGGTVLIGGDYQGKGTVPNASRTYVSNDSVINANSFLNNDGGRVIVWADKTTEFYGNISARGGNNFGNGGFVEVSGKESLVFKGSVDLSAPVGSVGTLLLDPENITIVDLDDSYGADDTAFGNGTQILVNDFPGASLVISRGRLENIAADANIILQALNNITINDLYGDELNLQATTGSITFTADADGSGVGDFSMNAGDTIITQGGAVTISGANITTGNIRTSAAFQGIDTLPSGNVTLSATGNITTGEIVTSNAFVDTVADAGSVSITSRLGTVNTDNIFAFANGNGGTVEINASSNITVSGITASSQDAGNAGNITLTSTAGTINLGENANSTDANAFGVGNAGRITLNANGDIVLAGQIQSISNNIGNAGDISLTSSTGSIIDTDAGNTGLIVSSADLGNGGNITLRAGSQINATSVQTESSSGQAGDIALIAGSDIIVGNRLITESTSGQAGDISVISTAGGITITSAQAIGVPGGGDISFTSNEIDFSLISSNGNLVLQPFTPSQAIAINSSDGVDTAALDLTQAEIDALSDGFSSITIGRSDGTGAITLNPVTFNVPTIIQTSTGAGSITTTPGDIRTNGNNLTLISNQINTSTSIIDTSTYFSGGGGISFTASGGITLGNLIATGSSNYGFPLPGGDITLIGPVTLANSSTNITTGISDGLGAGNIRFSSTINGTTPGDQALNLTVGTGTVTFDAAVGEVTPLGSLNVTGGNGSQVFVKSDLTISNNNLAFEQPVTLTGNATFNAGTGTIGFNSSLTTGNNALTLTADEIDFAGGANSVTGTSNLVLQPFTPTQNIAIAGDEDSGTGTLDITTTDIAALQNGFSSITIGGANSSGTITIDNPVTFNDPVTIQAPEGAGSISATGAITGLDNASITLRANQNITTGNITANPGITIISNNGAIDTSNGILDSSSTSNPGGAIALSALGDITTNNITSHSDTNAGGDITLNSQTGVVSSGNLDASGNTRGGNITVIAKNQITAGQINSSATTGDGGNVLLDPIGDIQVDFVNAQGGTAGKGGTVDITTNQFFRALSNFTDQNGINASLSTAGGTGSGDIVIRHDGGARGIPFDVGNASTNGTAGAITTGLSNSILPLQSFPGSYTQGNIQLIT
ncbi:MAG: glycosyltransferase, partial [Cyanobacteriota bacterium]